MEPHKDKIWLQEKYWGEELSLRKIAKIAMVSSSTIRRWMIKFGIKRRANWEYERTEEHKRKLRASIGGENCYNWKGGRIANIRGQVYIYKPDHPNATIRGYVFESRLIAEKALGRYLKPGEIVHHINGNPSDNRNRNLLICTQSYHLWLHYFDLHPWILIIKKRRI